MNGSTQTQTDWASIIGSANQAAIAWYQATRTPAVTGQQIGVSASIGPGQATVQASTTILIAGVLVIVAIVVLLK